jgi:hypothetical protein
LTCLRGKKIKTAEEGRNEIKSEVRMKGVGLLVTGLLFFTSCTVFDELLEPGDVLAQMLDNASPGVSIVSPANGYLTLSPEVTISGTAKMDKPFNIVRVQLQLNNGIWSDASGTSVWSKGLTLIEGSNTVIARAIADNGETNTSQAWALYASKYGWTHRIGGAGDDYGKSVKVDANGNIYITGNFSAALNFAGDWGGSANANAGVCTNTFIMKINADGSYGWTKQLGNDTVNCAGQAIAVDGNGNVYVTGSFSDIIDFAADFSGSDIKTNLAGSSDIFITKILSDGTYGWTHRMGGTTGDKGNSIAVDPAGNVYLTGYFNGTVVFDADWGGSDTNTNAGSSDIFITKISNNGEYSWTHRMGGTLNDQGNSIVVDQSGSIIVVGSFQSPSVNFGTDFTSNDLKVNLGSPFGDIFITKFNSDRTYGWTKILGGGGGDSGNSVAVDTSGNIYLSGSFYAQIDFHADWGTPVDERKSIYNDAFAMKILSDGSYGWAKKFGGFNYDYGNSITVNKNGDVYLTGIYFETVNFADDFMQAGYKTNAGSSDIFITKLNADGTYGWTKRFGGSDSEEGISVAVYGNNVIYLLGKFNSWTNNFAADFYGSDIVTNASGTSSDIFITKIAGW